jgi:hypothetical protein
LYALRCGFATVVDSVDVNVPYLPQPHTRTNRKAERQRERERERDTITHGHIYERERHSSGGGGVSGVWGEVAPRTHRRSGFS